MDRVGHIDGGERHARLRIGGDLMHLDGKSLWMEYTQSFEISDVVGKNTGVLASTRLLLGGTVRFSKPSPMSLKRKLKVVV